MEDGALTSALNLLEYPMDLDFMDQLLYDGCWVETTSDGFDFDLLPPQEEVQANDINNAVYTAYHQQNISLEESEAIFSGNVPSSEECLENEAQNLNTSEGNEVGKRWWIAPKSSSGPNSVRERLMKAVKYLNECTKDKDVLIQIWVPVKKEGRNVLTTTDQPYTLQSGSRSLVNYRNVSEAYQFPAEEDSKESVGMPGRVFLGKVPEWTPDVRFFRNEEYPRVNYAQECDVRGSLALPVFERGSGTCLGVVEIVTTSQKINYRPELESVCRALEAVDLRSSQSFTSSSIKARNQHYQAELPRILESITSICRAYRLPLALTWASCVQQCKEGSRHSSDNYELCVSTVDSACFVSDHRYLGFHEACAEHHLLRGQGIVGKAFTSNKLCSAADITAFSKTEYPLSHHARMFELKCAVAIPLKSNYTSSADFVLEFFLPTDCRNAEEQDRMLNSLTRSVLQEFQNFQVVLSPISETGTEADKLARKEETDRLLSFTKKEWPVENESWIANMMEGQQKGKGVGVSLEFQKTPKQEFKVTNEWEGTGLDLKQGRSFGGIQPVPENFESKPCLEFDVEDESSLAGFDLVDNAKSGQRRRTKTEKTISLQVLRQYFAGSLKDAAKSLGVCPTTLKRICRQHGINRWPSRKIKKVGHSLRKLQLVMDSVQGAEGSIQISSFYKSFPELNNPESGSLASSKLSDPSQQHPKERPGNDIIQSEATAVKSPSSSCSQSSSSTTSCSTVAKQDFIASDGPNCGDSVMLEDLGSVLKRVRSDAELHVSTQEEPELLKRSQSQKTLNEHPTLEALPPLPQPKSHNVRGRVGYRVKATFGDEKIRLSLQETSSFIDLQGEVAKRFSIEDVSRMDLKYLDDDDEWVLLTCDADLEECMDVYRMSQGRRTIRISVHQRNFQPSVKSSFGSSGTSQNHDRFL